MNKNYLNDTLIVRSKHTEKYTVFSNKLIQSKDYSSDEKNLLFHLLSLPESTYVINKLYFQQETSMGKRPYDKAWKGLSDKGHIHSNKLKKGNRWMYSYIITEHPYKVSWEEMIQIVSTQL